MNMPKVSVVIPVCNVEKYLRECIDSALAQTLKEIEIICVDDGSTDGSPQILDEYAAKDSRVKVIHKPNAGYGHTMNVGMDAATGEYFAILESDDVVKPDMYEVLYDNAKKQDVDFVKADYQIFVGDGKERQFTYRSITNRSDMYYRVINPTQNLESFNIAMMTWTGIYKLSFLRTNNIRHNESPGASYQDNGFWFQTFMWAKRAYFIDKPFYMLRRDNPNSSVHNRAKVFCIFDEYAFIEKILRNAPEKENALIGIFQKKKYDNCRFHLDRIGDEFKLDFLKRMAEEFKVARANDEIDKRLFRGRGYESLTEIMDYTEDFYAKYRLSKTASIVRSPQEEIEYLKLQIKAKDKEIRDLKSSVSFKIGRKITFIPRMIRGAIDCCKDHGLSYTVKRVFVRLGLKKEDEQIIRGYEFYKNLPESRYEDELKIWYKAKTGHELDLNNPQGINDKIQWMKLNDKSKEKSICACKYLVRDYVASTIGESYLVPLLGVWDRFDDIDFDTLPNRFVLKATHGCGWNIIVKDKTKLDLHDAKQKFNRWMNRSFAFCNGLELHYKAITPKIIAEQFLENADGDLYDYKVWCFNGKAEYIMFLAERQKGLKMAFYDLEWNKMPFVYDYPQYEKEVEKPSNLNELIDVAEKLAAPFSFARVDFYRLDDGTLKFGEITFTPASGACKWAPWEQNNKLGKLFDLDYSANKK